MQTHALPSEQSNRAAVRYSLAAPRRRLLLLMLVVVLALPLLWQSMTAAAPLRVDIGAWGDQAALFGANGREQSATENYRWTTDATQLVLPNISGNAQLLQFHAQGWRPDAQPSPVVRLNANGQQWGAFQTTPNLRTYMVLLPANSSLNYAVTFRSDAYQPPDDPRSIGFALDWAAIRALGQPAMPAAGQYTGQALLLVLLALLLWLLALPLGWSVGALAACCGALVWANWQQPLWVGQAIGAWLLIVALLIGATMVVVPWLQRQLAPWLSPQQARAAWALFVAALGLRLAGSVHPLFETHDINVHTGWLQTFINGQLYMYSTPGEMRNQRIFNPPGGYVMLAPLLLVLPSLRLAVQVGVALLDAVACLLLLPIARELRLSGSAALLALALAAALPISTTMLWWGFATNAMSQTLWILLLWVLLRVTRRPTRTATILFSIVVAVNMLMHAGVLVLLIAMLGLVGLWGLWKLPPRSRRALLGGLAAAVLLLVPIYFTGAAGPIVESRGDMQSGATINLGASLAKGWADRSLRLGYTTRAWAIGYGLPVLALLPVGFVSLVAGERRHVLQRALVNVWIVICVLFAAAYLSMATLTRYVYFSAPLVCLAAGATLAAYCRWPAGRVVAFAIVLFTAWVGISLWTGGVLLDLKPSIVPLSY